MRLSDIPTDYIILNASTDSEWDFCDFAIIKTDKNWIDGQGKKLLMIKALDDDYNFRSILYWDASCRFYQDDCDFMTNSIEFLQERQWSYLEATEAEIEKLTPPTNTLDYQRIVLKRGGYGMFSCVGKGTSDQFSTADFPLYEIVHP